MRLPHRERPVGTLDDDGCGEQGDEAVVVQALEDLGGLVRLARIAEDHDQHALHVVVPVRLSHRVTT
jgi:hypothetical protein